MTNKEKILKAIDNYANSPLATRDTLADEILSIFETKWPTNPAEPIPGVTAWDVARWARESESSRLYRVDGDIAFALCSDSEGFYKREESSVPYCEWNTPAKVHNPNHTKETLERLAAEHRAKKAANHSRGEYLLKDGSVVPWGAWNNATQSRNAIVLVNGKKYWAYGVGSTELCTVSTADWTDEPNTWPIPPSCHAEIIDCLNAEIDAKNPVTFSRDFATCNSKTGEGLVGK